MKKSRIWWYQYGSWSPSWWGYVIPYRGADEFGRRTLVFHIPFVGFMVWAYRTCHCSFCDEVREQTARWAVEEENDE